MYNTKDDLLVKNWTGLCYSAAMEWITFSEEPDWFVVHGTVWSKLFSQRIDHAWCERGEMVVDLTRPVGSRIIRRDEYYRNSEAVVGKVYPSLDALLVALKNGHHGPWNESEQLEE